MAVVGLVLFVVVVYQLSICSFYPSRVASVKSAMCRLVFTFKVRCISKLMEKIETYMWLDYWYFLSRQPPFFSKINVRWLEFRTDAHRETFVPLMMFGAPQQNTSGGICKAKIRFHNLLDLVFLRFGRSIEVLMDKISTCSWNLARMHVWTFESSDQHENMSGPEDTKGVCFWRILWYIKQISKNSAIDTPETTLCTQTAHTWT